MRTSLLPAALVAFCFAVAPAFCLAQQTPASPPASPTSTDANDQLATIAGTVLSANTGEPLKKAHVDLSQKGTEHRDDPDKQPFSATTDASGHFSIAKIPAGSYDLVVSRADYLPSHYGQDKPDKPGATLSLSAGQKMTDLLFRLNRMGIITGRVRDEDGDPVRGASVVVLLHKTVAGKLKIEPDGGDDTNDLGEYRIVDLMPGRYSIVATPPGVRSARRSYYALGSNQQSEEYIPTYYSGTTDSERASTVDVKSGDELSGIDFVFTPKPPPRTYRIRGHVLNTLTESPDVNISVLLFPRSKEVSALVAARKQIGADAKTGNFEIKDVAPGEYSATAFSFTGREWRTTTQNVDVVAADVDGVSMVLTPGIDIPVRVTFEGKSAASADFTVFLARDEKEPSADFGRSHGALKQRDGPLVLKDVGDGTYSIEIYSRCQECYLKSAKSNGVDLLERGILINSGAGPASIDIVYSSNTGTVAGAVTNKDELPAPGAMVVLVPDAGSHQKPDQYKTSPTDQYGHFEVRGVPPGHYKAFAWEKVDQESYGDSAFLKPLESMAESL